ncbi:MAG: preprotein translocase subunit SecG [Clostridia bacterium]
MGFVEVLFGIILIVFSIALIAIVLLQEGSQKNLGSISGGADTFLSKNQARTMDALLARVTKFVAVMFFVVVIVINIIMFFTAG